MGKITTVIIDGKSYTAHTVSNHPYGSKSITDNTDGKITYLHSSSGGWNVANLEPRILTPQQKEWERQSKRECAEKRARSFTFENANVKKLFRWFRKLRVGNVEN